MNIFIDEKSITKRKGKIMADGKTFTKVDLQSFVDFVFNSYAENATGFNRRSEKLVIESLYCYTRSITKFDGLETIGLVEQHAGEVLDAVSEANRSYFKKGIKLGARLLMALLDFE